MVNKIILFKDKLINFYFSDGIIFSKTLEENSIPAKIIEDVYFDFDVISDSDENIHIICQSNDGSIIYLLFSNGNWEKNVLLLSKTKTAYTKSFKLIMCSKLICLFYTIVKDAKPFLIFQHINTQAAPVVIDYISSAPRSFFVYPKENFDIDIYYQNQNGELGFKTYIWSKKEFSSFSVVCDKANNPFVIGDRELIANRDGTILYIGSKKTSDIFKTFSKEHPLPFSHKSATSTYFIWKDGNSLIFSKETPNGFSFPQKIPSPYQTPHLCEIKTTPKDTVYMFGIAMKNTISLLSPSGSISVSELFKKADSPNKNKQIKIDIILNKLKELERMIKEL